MVYNAEYYQSERIRNTISFDYFDGPCLNVAVMLLSDMLLDVVKDRHSCRPVTVSRSQLHIFLCHNDDKHDHVRLSAFILTEQRDGLSPFLLH